MSIAIFLKDESTLLRCAPAGVTWLLQNTEDISLDGCEGTYRDEAGHGCQSRDKGAPNHIDDGDYDRPSTKRRKIGQVVSGICD